MAHGRILILAQHDDDIALRAFAETQRRRGGDRVRLVSERDLLGARRWDHRIVDGRARTQIELADGFRIDSSELGVVLNRLQSVSAQHFMLWGGADATYALAETQALWLSWLESIEAPVFNRATPRGLSGAVRGEIEWLHLATMAGFAVRGWKLSTNPRRYAPPQFPALPLAIAAHDASPRTTAAHETKPLEAPLGQAPALFLERMSETTVLVTSIGGRLIGHLADWWRSEFLALHDLTSDTLLQGTFALRKGGAPGRKSDWRLCHLSSGVDVADDDVMSALVDLLVRSAAKPILRAASTGCRRVGLEAR